MLAKEFFHWASDKALVIMVWETTADGACGAVTANERGPGRHPKCRQPQQEERDVKRGTTEATVQEEDENHKKREER